MSRRETDREDLLREATALVERVELAPLDSKTGPNIVAGFRRDGAASIFFGADPVFHFNAAGELRRAYCDGMLLKAAHRRLVSLRRMRQQNQVQLLRHELTEVEQIGFLARMQRQLSDLLSSLDRNELKILGQAPNGPDIVGRLKEWLSRQDGAKIAAIPHVEGRGK